MANRNNQHIDSPAFKELAYRVLSKISPDQKGNLTPSELKHFNSEYTLQRFCKEERMDYILHIMAKCGIDWTFRIHEDSLSADMVEYNTVDQYRYPFKRLDNTEATARENVCIISSRDVMVLSHLVAQNCTTKVYHVSEFSKAMQAKGRDLKQLTSWDEEIVRAGAAYDLFNSILLEQLNSFEYAADILDLDEYDLRILCALYQKRQTALRMNEISQLTKATGKKMYFRKNIKKLMDAGLVASDQKDPQKLWANTTFFIITTAGLNKVINYMKFIYKNVFQ